MRIGALLPCNVVVRQDAQGAVHVEAMDPSAELKLVDHPALPALTAEVPGRFQLTLEALSA